MHVMYKITFLINHLQIHSAIHQICHWLNDDELQNHRQLLLQIYKC